jgi:hypothetical protein
MPYDVSHREYLRNTRIPLFNEENSNARFSPSLEDRHSTSDQGMFSHNSSGENQSVMMSDDRSDSILAHAPSTDWKGQYATLLDQFHALQQEHLETQKKQFQQSQQLGTANSALATAQGQIQRLRSVNTLLLQQLTQQQKIVMDALRATDSATVPDGKGVGSGVASMSSLQERHTSQPQSRLSAHQQIHPVHSSQKESAITGHHAGPQSDSTASSISSSTGPSSSFVPSIPVPALPPSALASHLRRSGGISSFQSNLAPLLCLPTDHRRRSDGTCIGGKGADIFNRPHSHVTASDVHGPVSHTKEVLEAITSSTDTAAAPAASPALTIPAIKSEGVPLDSAPIAPPNARAAVTDVAANQYVISINFNYTVCCHAMLSRSYYTILTGYGSLHRTPSACHHSIHASGIAPGGGNSTNMNEEDSDSDYRPPKRYVNTDHTEVLL